MNSVKKHPPAIGLPEVILVNENEIIWTGRTPDVFKILDACQKIPSLVFEYDQWPYFGSGYNIKLFENGVLVKTDYDIPEDIPESEVGKNVEHTFEVGPTVVKEIKKIIKENKKRLQALPRNLTNHHVLDGAKETVRFGRIKFSGDNMISSSAEEFVKYYKERNDTKQTDYFCAMKDVQNLFSLVMEKLKSII